MGASSSSVVPANGATFQHRPQEVTVDWPDRVLGEAGALGDHSIASIVVRPIRHQALAL